MSINTRDIIFVSISRYMTDTVDIQVPLPVTEYRIRFHSVTVNDFAGQSSRADLSDIPWIFGVNDVAEFVQKLWERVRPHLRRGVIFTNNTSGDIECQWMDEDPVIEDICLYTKISSTVGHRPVDWLPAMEPRKLRTLTDKNLKLNIYKYSSFVSSKSHFTRMERTLITPQDTDRAGIATINVINAMKKRLKRIHGESYQASDNSWGIWANFILQKSAEIHDDIVTFGPPVELVTLFVPTNIPAQVSLDNIRRSNHAGSDMVETILQEFKVLKTEFNLRIDGLERILNIYKRQYSANIESTQQTVETKQSKDILSQVTNKLDVDHMDEDDS